MSDTPTGCEDQRDAPGPILQSRASRTAVQRNLNGSDIPKSYNLRPLRRKQACVSGNVPQENGGVELDSDSGSDSAEEWTPKRKIVRRRNVESKAVYTQTATSRKRRHPHEAVSNALEPTRKRRSKLIKTEVESLYETVEPVKIYGRVAIETVADIDYETLADIVLDHESFEEYKKGGVPEDELKKHLIDILRLANPVELLELSRDPAEFIKFELIPAITNFRDFRINPSAFLNSAEGHYELYLDGQTIIEVPASPRPEIFPSQIWKKQRTIATDDYETIRLPQILVGLEALLLNVLGAPPTIFPNPPPAAQNVHNAPPPPPLQNFFSVPTPVAPNVNNPPPPPLQNFVSVPTPVAPNVNNPPPPPLQNFFSVPTPVAPNVNNPPPPPLQNFFSVPTPVAPNVNNLPPPPLQNFFSVPTPVAPNVNNPPPPPLQNFFSVPTPVAPNVNNPPPPPPLNALQDIILLLQQMFNQMIHDFWFNFYAILYRNLH